MWTGCVKYVDCHVCWGVSHISPRYVNPSVSPPQGAAQAWHISAHCPCRQGVGADHTAHLCHQASCKPEAVPGVGSWGCAVNNMPGPWELPLHSPDFVEFALYLQWEVVHPCQAATIHDLWTEGSPMQILRTVWRCMSSNKEKKIFCLSASLDILTPVWMLA